MIFDTDVFIWGLRGNKKAAKIIDATPKRALSAVSYMELMKGARDKRELRGIRLFIHDLGFELLPLTENISHRAIIYMEEFALKSGIDMADVLIAATVEEEADILCTANAKHYRIIPGLKLSVFRP